MLSPTTTTIRLFLHVLSACVWVGGQITLAGLVPPLRRAVPEATKVAARAFNRIAWPAFGVLLVTGIWNLIAVKVADTSTSYQVTLFVKLVLVAASGIAAFIHTQGRSRMALAIGGSVGAFASLAALFVGVLLHAH